MSFSDNLENDLKNLESSQDERDPISIARAHQRKLSQRSSVLAAAPHAEKLRTGKFTSGLLTHATRIGHGLRTKVNIMWMGTTLRLQAREHKLELQPTPDGVIAHFLVDDKEVKKEKVDLSGNPEKLAKEWLDSVGPRPTPEPIPDFEEEDED
jgi:hypothetical protein